MMYKEHVRVVQIYIIVLPIFILLPSFPLSYSQLPFIGNITKYEVMDKIQDSLPLFFFLSIPVKVHLPNINSRTQRNNRTSIQKLEFFTDMQMKSNLVFCYLESHKSFSLGLKVIRFYLLSFVGIAHAPNMP